MTRTITVSKVEETSLWIELSERDTETSKYLAHNVAALCEQASDRMKAMAGYAPQYTLHDDRHLLRVTEIMGLLLGTEMEKLNEIELALLILSAFYHDQGMIPSHNDFSKLKESEDYKLFQDNWRVDHPNYAETSQQLGDPTISVTRKEQLGNQIAEFDGALLIDFLRLGHGKRSSDYVVSTYQSDKRIEVQGVNLARLIGRLCESHVLSAEVLNPRGGFRYDEDVGNFRVNMPVLAVVLRLADILDFDRDRTPEVLLKSIHFTSLVSLFEWEKHRSVEGWAISEDIIRFVVRCKHPAYQAAALAYMDWIDNELETAHSVCRQQPRDIDGYQLRLPTHVDRSRIEPDGDSYRYHDLEFSLSRDEIIRLLMTDKLYGGVHLCIRELLQNSLDALRYRQALFAESEVQWDKGQVEFRHFLDDDGYEVVECRDNGVGMDEQIIRRYLVNVGRSYYLSPDFERERTRLKATGNDFDPCSKFGIGFMSCFMLGDRITIETRKDYGLGRRSGEPLVIEIQGLSGLLIVRKGSENQPIGTTVQIVSRKKPSFLDEWTDQVQLTTVLRGYALATEFPISGRCEAPGIAEVVEIPTTIEKTPTLLELVDIKAAVSLEQDLTAVTKSLRGFIRESFLLDEAGLPCLANSEAAWVVGGAGLGKEWELQHNYGNSSPERDSHEYITVCIDGILIGGEPGRYSDGKLIRHRLGWRNSGIYCSSPALIDARGELKPEITPGRVPVEQQFSRRPPGWRRLNEKFKVGYGMLGGQLAKFLSNGLSPETFWQLAVVHGIPVEWIPSEILWDALSVPLVDDSDGVTWCRVRELGELIMCSDEKEAFSLQNKQGASVDPGKSLINWEASCEQHPTLSWRMRSCVLLLSTLDVVDNQVVLTPIVPSDLAAPLGSYLNSDVGGVNTFFIGYLGSATKALSVEAPFPTANRNHPLVELAQQSINVTESTDLQRFASAFVTCISKSVSSKDTDCSLNSTSYWQKRVGYLYFAVQWDQYASSLKPPYQLWTKEQGWLWFKEADFLRWRDAEISLD